MGAMIKGEVPRRRATGWGLDIHDVEISYSAIGLSLFRDRGCKMYKTRRFNGGSKYQSKSFSCIGKEHTFNSKQDTKG